MEVNEGSLTKLVPQNSVWLARDPDKQGPDNRGFTVSTDEITLGGDLWFPAFKLNSLNDFRAKNACIFSLRYYLVM